MCRMRVNTTCTDYKTHVHPKTCTTCKTPIMFSMQQTHAQTITHIHRLYETYVHPEIHHTCTNCKTPNAQHAQDTCIQAVLGRTALSQ